GRRSRPASSKKPGPTGWSTDTGPRRRSSGPAPMSPPAHRGRGEVMATVARMPFGRTGHDSSRVIFGAAALGRMRQERADELLPTLDEFGVNHIDVAAGYGDAELRLAPWLATRRSQFFLATKTHERGGSGARASLERSLERL